MLQERQDIARCLSRAGTKGGMEVWLDCTGQSLRWFSVEQRAISLDFTREIQARKNLSPVFSEGWEDRDKALSVVNAESRPGFLWPLIPSADCLVRCEVVTR